MFLLQQLGITDDRGEGGLQVMGHIGEDVYKRQVLRRTACRCGRELTFYIFAFHVPIYGVMKEWSDTVPGFAWAMERSWLLPFLVAVLSTLLALSLIHI